MDVRRELQRFGGVARRVEIVVAQVGRTEFDRAVNAGEIRRSSRGLYTTDQFPNQGLLVASKLGGILSHLSAARRWGIGLTVQSRRWEVTVPRNADRRSRPDDVQLHYCDVPPDDVANTCTTVTRTVVDCLRSSPVHLALAVLESAVESGRVSLAAVAGRVGQLRGPGSAQARRILGWYDARACPPLESALRGILLDGGITCFRPQFEVWDGARKIATTDLGDASSRILLEADSFLNHGSRDQLARDAARYDNLVALDYCVLPFTYPPIAAGSPWVLETVRRTLATQDRAQNSRIN